MPSNSSVERDPGKAIPGEPSEPRGDGPPEQERDDRVPVSHQVPDEVEWEESLIGIEPNSGVVDPPAIC